MRLDALTLNRTLLARQHLLARVDATVPDEVRWLVGLQAQESISPYLGLSARLADFSPATVSSALRGASLVRILAMRGTVHLLEAADAVTLRPWVQPVLSRQRNVEPRLVEPLAQMPPRGCWGESGGVVYGRVDEWTGLPLAQPDVPSLVLRYLSAFGPASAADMTAWSGMTRLGPTLAAMDLERHEDTQGRTLYDVPGGSITDASTPAPVRLLGTYDNLWLSHADRSRVTTPEGRALWTASNGGAGHVILADGWLVGIWRAREGRVELDDLLRPLTPAERVELDEEIARVERLFAA